MNAQAVNNNNAPVYNLRRSVLEATTKNLSKEDLALRIFNALKTKKYLTDSAKFDDFKAGMTAAIKDRDKDGYLDVDIRDLFEAIRCSIQDWTISSQAKIQEAKEIIAALNLKCLSKSSRENLKAVSRDLQSALPLAPYFWEPPVTVRPVKSAGRTIRDALQYIKQEYSGPWNKAKADSFKDYVKQFLAQHFVETPVKNAAEAADPVNDELTRNGRNITDELLEERFSKGGAGHYRVDCAVYANIASQLFQAAGMQVSYCFVVLGSNISGAKGNSAGHLVAVGEKGLYSVTVNNAVVKSYDPVSFKGKGAPLNLLNAVARDCRAYGFVVGSIDSGLTPEAAVARANANMHIRMFNCALGVVQEPKLTRQTITAAKDYMNKCVELAMRSSHGITIVFGKQSLTGIEEIKAFKRQFDVVLDAYAALLPGSKQPAVADQNTRVLKAMDYFRQFNNDSGECQLYQLAGQYLESASSR